MLEKENNDLRKMNISDGQGKDDLSTQMIEEKEEIIKGGHLFFINDLGRVSAFRRKPLDR